MYKALISEDRFLLYDLTTKLYKSSQGVRDKRRFYIIYIIINLYNLYNP